MANLTWRQLEEYIKNMAPEHKDDDAMVHIEYEDEFHALVDTMVTVSGTSEGSGILDDGCSFLRIEDV